MQIATTRNILGKAIAELRDADPYARIGFVPTMGALHEGHLTLVRRAREACDHVVASVFVNPTQFAPNEDLDAYPRQLQEDASMLEAEGCKLLFAPDVSEIYPDGFATTVSVSGVSDGLDGAARPGHFDGVATVVAKLFNIVRPTHAFFGEKDFQQLAVIRRMARDLDLSEPAPDNIIGVPTVREPDGLAMSSRNRYLSPEERTGAATLPRAMKATIAAVLGGAAVEQSLSDLKAALLEAGFGSVDYAVIADSASLRELDTLGDAPSRLLVAARIGTTRLIDNMAVK
ncbi:MAG: pantoate--beta-alanine ligase [Pseudomonadota bacterium]